MRDTIFLRKLGPSYIAKAFQWAAEADPKAQLIYNDYGIEVSNVICLFNFKCAPVQRW